MTADLYSGTALTAGVWRWNRDGRRPSTSGFSYVLIDSYLIDGDPMYLDNGGLCHLASVTAIFYRQSPRASRHVALTRPCLCLYGGSGHTRTSSN